MAIEWGWPWWYFVSFFAVGVAQHPMIVGISLPLYSIHFGKDASLPWGLLDTIATILCICGILIAYFADTQLREYMV